MGGASYFLGHFAHMRFCYGTWLLPSQQNMGELLRHENAPQVPSLKAAGLFCPLARRPRDVPPPVPVARWVAVLGWKRLGHGRQNLGLTASIFSETNPCWPRQQ